MNKVILFLISVALFSSCSGGGGSNGNGGGGVSSSNKFTMAGSPLSIDSITGASAFSEMERLAISQPYYGRVLYTDGSSLYSAAIHFTLNKNDSTTAYFTDFFIDRLVEITSITTVSPIVTSSTNLNAPGAYGASTNGLSIANATSRFVKFSINFGNNTHFSDIVDAGVMFSSDFSTMVGGDDSSFFFIAQKSSSMQTVTIADLLSTWSLANFEVDNSGSVIMDSTSTVTVNGTGGNGYTAFTGTSGSASFKGEVGLIDAGTGAYIFGYDTSNATTPTADGTVHGGFLLSPDKNYVLGYDLTAGTYFAASK